MKIHTLPTDQGARQSLSMDRVGRDGRGLSDTELRAQNCSYSGSGGVSHHNRRAGFIPAYKDMRTGVTIVSRFTDGRQAPVHVLEGLPDNWVASRDRHGNVRQLFSTVIAGFVRDGSFFTREAAARILADEDGA